MKIKQFTCNRIWAIATFYSRYPGSWKGIAASNAFALFQKKVYWRSQTYGEVATKALIIIIEITSNAFGSGAILSDLLHFKYYFF
jgi:hypothetical protein